MRRAFRRPITNADLEQPLAFYREARDSDGFEAGIESALSYILVSPEFLFRVEEEPPAVAPNSVYRVPDLQLASRLSFFLWSSIPDDELLDMAVRGELSKPEILAQQTRRMLAFTLSLDDLVIASFTSGPGATTLPMKIYSQVRLGVTPEINAVCTILIGIVAVGVIAASLVNKRREVQRLRDEQAAMQG